MNLILITDRDESARAFAAFEAAFGAGGTACRDKYIGWQGGNVQLDVSWHEQAGIWGVFQRQPPDESKGGGRFWNCFGIDDPAEASMLAITVEMNPPHQGENRRTAGVFLRDEAGRYHVGHSGKVGGGRPGIGQEAFRNFSRHLAWQEVATPSGVREVVVFGPLEGEGLADDLAPFVHTVAEFKESIANRQ